MKLFKSKKGTNNQTIIIFIALLFYFISLPFLFSAISKDIPSMTSCYETSDTTFLTGTIVGEFVTTVGCLPLWLNTLLIIIPFALLVGSGALLILHG